MNTAPIKLTEDERTTIVNALTVAARQYEIDAERASELALHGMTVFEPARGLAKQFQVDRRSTTTRQNHVSLGAHSALNYGGLGRRFPPP